MRIVEADHESIRTEVVDDGRARMGRRGVGILLMLGVARAFRLEGDDRERHWLRVNGICMARSGHRGVACLSVTYPPIDERGSYL